VCELCRILGGLSLKTTHSLSHSTYALSDCYFSHNTSATSSYTILRTLSPTHTHLLIVVVVFPSFTESSSHTTHTLPGRQCTGYIMSESTPSVVVSSSGNHAFGPLRPLLPMSLSERLRNEALRLQAELKLLKEILQEFPDRRICTTTQRDEYEGCLIGVRDSINLQIRAVRIHRERVARRTDVHSSLSSLLCAVLIRISAPPCFFPNYFSSSLLVTALLIYSLSLSLSLLVFLFLLHTHTHTHTHTLSLSLSLSSACVSCAYRRALAVHSFSPSSIGDVTLARGGAWQTSADEQRDERSIQEPGAHSWRSEKEARHCVFLNTRSQVHHRKSSKASHRNERETTTTPAA
jgi:hypothetical protein